MRYGGLIKASRTLPSSNATEESATLSGVWSIRDAVQLHGSQKYPIPGNTGVDGRANTTTAFICTGYTGSGRSDAITKKTFDSNGNATDWYNTGYVANARMHGTISNYTVGWIAGGYTGSYDYSYVRKITFATDADATAFGSLSGAGAVNSAGHMSETRGITCGGRYSSNKDTIYYRQIATGSTLSLFGTLSAACYEHGAHGSTTKMIITKISTGNNSNVMEEITMSTLSNSSDYGDLVDAADQVYMAGNDTLGFVVNTSYGGGALINQIQKINSYASSGASIDYGNKISTTSDEGAVGDDVRCMIYGDNNFSQNISQKLYASSGNATDYGDLVTGCDGGAGQSHN